MVYALGIDLGTSYSATAVAHPDGRVEMFQLGQRSAAMPSLVLVRADGEILVGEAAERRALTEPARTAREFKRRLGDPVPIILGGTPYGPDALMAIVLRAVVDHVTREFAAAPAHVVVTHPASYGPYKLDLLRQAARQAGLDSVSFISEPVAAAVHYASLEQVPTAATIAVYDFGGGTFDATILRKDEAGFRAIGTPEGLERLGGADFDEAIFRHVLGALGPSVASLDGSDPHVQADLARLREECRRAKEALSSDSDATIPVSLPGVQTEIRITRGELEAMIEPRIAETLAALERSAKSASVRLDEIDRVLLVGGTSRIPRIAERIRAATGRPVAVDVHPKHGVALGAARLALAELTAGDLRPATVDANANANANANAESEPLRADMPAVADAMDSPPGEGRRAATLRPPTPPRSAAPASTAPRSGGARPPWLLPVALIAVVAVLGAVAALGSGLLSGTPGPLSPSPTEALARRTLPPAPTPLPTIADAAGFRASITSVNLVGDHYEAAFVVAGFTPSMSGQHLHFFWDTVQPADAGEPGKGPYVVYSGSSPFAEFRPGGKPAAARAICVIVANPDHTVVAGSGACAAPP